MIRNFDETTRPDRESPSCIIPGIPYFRIISSNSWNDSYERKAIYELHEHNGLQGGSLEAVIDFRNFYVLFFVFC